MPHSWKYCAVYTCCFLLARSSCIVYMVLVVLGNMKHCIKMLVSKQPIESLYDPAF